MGKIQKTGMDRKQMSGPVVVIQTSLYEIIETVLDSVGPEENHAVTPVMRELLGAYCPAVNVVDA